MEERQDMKGKSRASRDPAGRRKAIVEACADLIVSEGIRKITNRRVAERAGVPLGSTTQYFKSVDDLRHAGLIALAGRVEQEYETMFAEIDSDDFTAEAFVQALRDFLSDEGRVQAMAELYAAAIDDTSVRAIAQRLHGAFVKVCTPFLDDKRLAVLETFIDGALVHACIYGQPMAEDALLLAMQLILNEKKEKSDE